jgi:hypothetical protein
MDYITDYTIVEETILLKNVLPSDIISIIDDYIDDSKEWCDFCGAYVNGEDGSGTADSVDECERCGLFYCVSCNVNLNVRMDSHMVPICDELNCYFCRRGNCYNFQYITSCYNCLSDTEKELNEDFLY